MKIKVFVKAAWSLWNPGGAYPECCTDRSFTMLSHWDLVFHSSSMKGRQGHLPRFADDRRALVPLVGLLCRSLVSLLLSQGMSV